MHSGGCFPGEGDSPFFARDTPPHEWTFAGKTYRKVIQKLKNARMIDIYSVENSEVTALDLLTKLLYLGLPCRHFSDYYFQRISAGSLTSDDVAVGNSYSGESKDTRN